MTNLNPVWFGNMALLLLLVSAFSARLDHVRAGIALAAAFALFGALLAKVNVGPVILLVAVLAVHGALAVQARLRDAGIRFTAEEQRLRDRHFSELGAQAARSLIDQGHWLSARNGEVLIRENNAAPCLFYLAEGTATILRDGSDVGTLGDGSLIGEATVLDGGQATGTVLLTSNSRLWFVPAAGLRAYLAANPDVAGALHEGFARALRGKLGGANARIADMPAMS